VFDVVRDIKKVLTIWEDKYGRLIPVIVAGGIWDRKDIYRLSMRLEPMVSRWKQGL